MANDGRLKIGFGTLNNIEDSTFGQPILDIENSSAFNAIKQTLLNSYKKDTLSNSGPYRGIVLRVDINPSNNPLTSWLHIIGINAKPRISVKVRIPELHAALPDPANYGPNAGSSNHIIDMYPNFVAISDEISNEPPSPGSIVWVDFGNRNNMADPIYLGIDVNNATGGAVGRDNAKDKFNDFKAPLNVLPPVGDDMINKIKNENNQIPRSISIQPTSESEMTIGDFDEQKNHINDHDGMPIMKSVEMAYKNGSPIGAIELVEVPHPYASKNGVFITKSQKNNFYSLVEAAKSAGIDLRLNSGFRSQEQQEYLYNGYKSGDSNFNPAARPGYSKHQSGDAFDISVGGHTSKEYEWLSTNAHKFGFYNEGSVFNEGKKEPWHWVYLGTNNETVISEGETPLSEKLARFT